METDDEYTVNEDGGHRYSISEDEDGMCEPSDDPSSIKYAGDPMDIFEEYPSGPDDFYADYFYESAEKKGHSLFENILKENNPYQFVGIETGVEGNSVRADFLSRAGKDSPVPGAISRTPITRANIAPEANATGEDSAKMNNLVNTAMVNAKRNPKAYGTYNPKTVDFTFGPAGTTLATPDASQSPAQIPTLKTK